MYRSTTLPHPHGHSQLQELLGSQTPPTIHSQSVALFALWTEVILRIIADWASVLSIPGKHVSGQMKPAVIGYRRTGTY